MKLIDYLLAANLSDDQFAEAIGGSLGAVRKWKSGERIPRPDWIRRIGEATGGKVTANDFFRASEAAEAAE